MIIRLLIFLTLMAAGISRADVPKLFCERSFNSIILADAVNYYVRIGQEQAVKELRELAEVEGAEKKANRGFNVRGYSINERIGWVCRILFDANMELKSNLKNAKQPLPYLRAPRFGRLSVPEKYMPIDKWPLYPVVLSGSSYFVISESYSVFDANPETPQEYIQYCLDYGIFRKTPVPIPTKEQMSNDVMTLHNSSLWKSIKWQDDDGFSYPMGDQWTWAFVQRQTKVVSK